MTLACEDAYSELVEVVTVADNDDKNRVAQGLVRSLKLKFRRDFEAEVWLRLQS